MEDGTLRLMPSAQPVDRAQPGDIIECKLDIESSTNREFIQVVDFPPTNCRVTERELPGEGEDWSDWWTSTQIRDDHIAFFAKSLAKGPTRITYTMRAESPGLSHALPCQVSNMYDPSVSASTAEDVFEVSR